MLAMQKTMTIPAERRLRLDMPVPDAIDTGRVEVTLFIRPLPAEREARGSPPEPSAEPAGRGSPPDELEKCLREGIERLRGNKKEPERPKISVREAIDWLDGCAKDTPGTVDDFLLQCRIDKEKELARENPSVEDDYYAELARRGLSS